MGSLSFAEIVTILLVVLIVFGPNRLPEFARKLGELMAQARRATSQFSKEISGEWGDAVAPIVAVKEDFDGVKKDLKDATAAIAGFGATESTEPVTGEEKPKANEDEYGYIPVSSGAGDGESLNEEPTDDDVSPATDRTVASEPDGDAKTTDAQRVDPDPGDV